MTPDRAPRSSAESAAHDAARSRPPSYARGVRAGAVMFLILGVILLTLSAVVDMLSAPRSALLGAGIIAVSSAATALVAAQMYRVAPAATAPALAALYLLKVLVLGWFLLFLGAPPWLAPRVFAVTVLVCLVLALAGFTVLTRGVTRQDAPEPAPHAASSAVEHAHDDAAAAPSVPPARDSSGGRAGHDRPTHERRRP